MSQRNFKCLQMSTVSVIIVAGGSGRRMGSSVPKQFLTLGTGTYPYSEQEGISLSADADKSVCRQATGEETTDGGLFCNPADYDTFRGITILEITLRRFLAALPGCDTVVVLPEGEIRRWKEICAERKLDGTHRICAGGATRFDSVRNGIKALGPCDYIAVHDGVRPLVTAELILRCTAAAEEYGTAIPAIPPTDSFRITEAGDRSRTLDRNLLRAVQTPQIFRADILRNAYEAEYDPSFTDDASVVEASGTEVTLCEGERENIKITSPEDLTVAGALLELQLRRNSSEPQSFTAPLHENASPGSRNLFADSSRLRDSGRRNNKRDGDTILETERLILRPWREDDAGALYKYASSPLVGPAAGWPVHTGVENSRGIIRDVLSAPHTFAVVLKESAEPVGSIGLMIGAKSNFPIGKDEGELGYWIGEPYWGRGLIPEAAREMLSYGFGTLRLKRIWCGYFDGNEKSRRVQQKCGFTYHHTNRNVNWELTGEIKTEHIACMTREEWEAGSRLEE